MTPQKTGLSAPIPQPACRGLAGFPLQSLARPRSSLQANHGNCLWQFPCLQPGPRDFAPQNPGLCHPPCIRASRALSWPVTILRSKIVDSPWARKGLQRKSHSKPQKRFARNCSGKPGFSGRGLLRNPLPEKCAQILLLKILYPALFIFLPRIDKFDYILYNERMKNFRCFFTMVVLLGLISAACTAPPPAPPPVEPPAEPAPPVVQVEEPAVKISQEEYDKTFAEVEAVILELNDTIKTKNMGKWEKYLTREFRDSIMSPQNLGELNERPLLKRNNITIKTLKEYFEYVVVPSRANVRLDDLKFTDEKRVQAFMTVNEENVLIYQLEKLNNEWKISYWK
jgi:hypothetical protein